MLTQVLLRRGHSVDVISGPPYPHLPEGARLIRLPSLDLHGTRHRARQWRWGYCRDPLSVAEFLSTWSGGFPEPWLFGRRLLAWLERLPDQAKNYDVIHDNQGLFSALIDIQQRELPLFATLHHPVRRDLELQLAFEPKLSHRLLLHRWYRFLGMQDRTAVRLRRLVTVSAAAAEDWAECTGIARERIRIIPNGVDLNRYLRTPGVAPEPGRLFALASADAPYKGLDFLLNALALLRADREFAHLHLVLLCNLNTRSRLHERIADLGLDGAVQVVQGLSDAAVVEQYCRAETVVVPSVYEGFGLPLIEAMACGAAVVTTSGGALGEVAGEACEVVAPGDADALVRGVRRVLGDAAYRTELRRRAPERIAEHYSLERMGERYESWYLEELGR